MDPILKCKPKIPVRRQGQSLVPWIYVSDRGLVFRIHKDISKLSNKKKQMQFFKWSKSFGQTLHQTRYMDDKYLYGKMQVKTTELQLRM